VGSGEFDGLPTAEFKERMTAWLDRNGKGRKAVNYKLRDWVFSRQRYWGEPIPLVHCPDCGIVPVPESELPLTLPQVDAYKPTGTGESPLATILEWVNTSCPKCGAAARRETNTMPQWAGSCWYYLRYLDPTNGTTLAARDKMEYWLPVNLYVGGAEHAVLHLLYSRFWHKFLYDIGVVPTEEPFLRLVNQGMILGEGGVKMSKSLGNVINPDDVVAEYGADSMRMYEMFMGPLEDSKPWSTQGITGIKRFLDRVWTLGDREPSDESMPDELRRVLHKSIKKVREDTGALAFNTAISQMMILVNEAYRHETLYREMWEPFLLILAPYAPHLCEELWQELGGKGTVAFERLPEYDERLVLDEVVTVVFQVNGKVRAKEELPADLGEQELVAKALANPRIRELTAGKDIVKTFAVPGRLVNIVVKETAPTA
jgi:leucyl-tRNA synthetase